MAVLQDLHVPRQVLLQQTPSTQKPLRQSPAQPHAWPFVLPAPNDVQGAPESPGSRGISIGASLLIGPMSAAAASSEGILWHVDDVASQ
jgi:hypothetical protein